MSTFSNQQIAAQPQTVDWPGQSNTKYRYWVYPRHTTFNGQQPGNYIYAKLNAQGLWVPIYIGQTGNLNERITANHEKAGCIDRNGATHIHVHTTPAGEKARLAEEKDLILFWQPVCNIQHVR